ncbi:PREDICTED: uncharacterized protein LOC109128143 [Camelina sativa]|uniref:Uncharacterized protein LOC109128143 n=1 Tax=Camelina sativa TaxID=90675 RepID=A0ABM1QRV1_CAMSA|nr:PREDICTED: uncharacterized protein LOC109128143 [Camelina sativa]
MGHDYSYSQPDSSDQAAIYSDDTEGREIAALIRMDEVESTRENDQAMQYPPQPEVEFGFPKVCYCGGQPLLSSSYNRRYFTCANVDDGEMHIHKWWDIAVMEEMGEMNKQCQVLSEKVDSLTIASDYDSHINTETKQKIVMLEKVVLELRKSRNRFRNGTELIFVIAIVVCLICMVVMSMKL